MIVKLTPEEIEDATKLATQRNAHKITWTKNQWTKKHESVDNHIWGLKCELAVAKLLGIDVDREIHDGDKDNPDLYYKGYGIQVKGRRQRGWDFGLRSDDINEFKSHIGILCWPTDKKNEIDVVGYITKKKFKSVAIIKNYKYGNRLVAEAKHFKEIKL